MSERRELVLSSDRKFGIVFSVVFGLIAGFLIYKAQVWSAASAGLATLAVLFLLAATLLPKVLHPFNIAWMTLGLWLGKITSPIVLGVIFFLLFTPLAVFFRLIGRDELSLKRAPSSPTYWKAREARDAKSDSFRNLF